MRPLVARASWVAIARGVPRPLIALLAVTLLFGLSWSLVTPAFQAPDENAHFGYTQALAESFRLPGDADRPAFSREQKLGAVASNAEQAASLPATKMEWSERAYERWRATEARLPRSARTDGGGPNPASGNPPLSYLVEVPAYRLAEQGDLFTRLEVVRLTAVLWGLVTVTAVWLLAGEVFSRDRVLQLAAAGAAALAPMLQFVSSSVSPDGMLFAIWTLTLWAGVRVLKRGLTARAALGLFALIGVGCVVKASSYALLPGALVVLMVGIRRARSPGKASLLPPLAGAVAGLAGTVGIWVVVARSLDRAAAAQVSASASPTATNVREFLSYVWQFYLPRLPHQTLFPSQVSAPQVSTIHVYDIWLQGAWGSFGWLEVKFPEPAYVILGVATVAVAVLAVVSLWRYRRTSDWAVGAFLIVVAGTLLAALHWTEYHLLKTGGAYFNQGRYLLPLVGVAGLAVAQALRPFGPRGRAQGVAVVLGGLFALDLLSIGLMMERFYA